jgi:hypothetical protein
MIDSAGWEILERSPIIFLKTGRGFRKLTVREVLKGGPSIVVGKFLGLAHVGWRVRPVTDI